MHFTLESYTQRQADPGFGVWGEKSKMTYKREPCAFHLKVFPRDIIVVQVQVLILVVAVEDY